MPLCVAVTLVFIFSNSLQTGEQSSASSSEVVDIIQDSAQTIAPDSFVAKAEGEDYDLLHSIVRNIAHFSEFMLLGVFVAWTYFVYFKDKSFLLVAFMFLACMPILDESIQSTVAGRGAEFTDVLIDTMGCFCGFLIGWVTQAIVRIIANKTAAKQTVKGE